MLTLGKSNTTQAKNYYKQENYYSQEEAQANSAWQGKGASGYQLAGAIVDLSAYDNIVNGLSPDGKTQLRQKQNHQDRKELAGTDLTFSAPKSVSIACLVGGDKRLEEAHRIAVSRTIDLIESRYVTTRINKQPVQSDNLIVAKWHHDTSRELDPHLHTHCLIMNCTQGSDGKWRSINNKAFYQHKILLGQIYRNELALECRKLGYEIERHPQELFEIKGYTREQIEGFSKRHEQIKDKLIEMGAELTTENKAWAWRKTRAKKNHEIRREEKLPYWEEEADLYGITHPVPTKGQAVEPTSNGQDEEIAAEIKLAVDVAIEHCSERQVAFTGEDIEKFVIAEVKPFSIHQLEQAIAQHPELIKTYDGRRQYTTQTALARELATIKLMQQGKGLCSAIASPETIDNYLADKSLTSGQREAIALSATSTDQFIAWQGVAGAGKTYVLKELKQLIQVLKEVTESGEITLLAGYAPSKEATKVLGLEVGIETNTVASLLLSKQPEETKPNGLWIVDEASMLSAKDGYALLQRATAVGARVILVGDTRQLSAVEAGNPFKSLQQAGISTAHLNQSLRQKVPDLQHAASLAAAGNHFDALQHLEAVGRLTEVCDLDERNTLIAGDYLQLSPDQRQTTLVLVGTHKEKDAVMEHIRVGLKEEGTLTGSEAVLTRLKRKDLTKVQSRYCHNYNIGDVVIPLREYKRAGLHKDRAYAICGYEADKLILSDWSGNQVAVDPMKFRKTVYTQQEIAICVGEQLRWIKEDKQSGRGNRDEFTVMAIEGRTATIRYKNGKEESLYLDQPLPLDYALASTTYSSQGKTADRVLVSSTVDATVSQESVYVAISRVKYDLKIYAENVDFLLEQAQESKAQKTVLELLQPSSKVQVAAVPARAGASSVERSADVSKTPKLSSKDSAPIISIKRPLKRKDQQAAKFTPNPILKKEPPKQLEVFWQPNSDRPAPSHIEAKHWRELVEGSAIHPDIAALNFRSLQMGSIEQEHQAWEYLMYSDKLERTNIGQLTTGMLKRYAHIEAGGWWCNSGANALSFSNLQSGNNPPEKIWGCYKPNEPRSNPDKPGKVIKYEHPPKTDLGIFLLDVPDYVAQKIYQKAGIDPSQEDRDRGFWYCVWKHNLPIVITEGAKKAASLLSQGHAAIGLPGIYAGYRSKDDVGNPIKAHLHEELAAFATLGREITFCFDFETRLETKQNIEIAISRTGSLLRQQGAKVSVVSLPGPEKGVDDLIIAQSPLAFEQQLSAALPLQQWREVNKQQRHSAMQSQAGFTIAPPQKLSIEQRKERLNQSLSGQPPIHDQNLNQSQEQISHDSIEQRQLKGGSTADGRNIGTDGDRHLDKEHRRLESSKPSSLRGEQGTQELHPQAVERYSLDSQANAGRIHHPVAGSYGAKQIGQTERNNPRVSDIDEQPVAQAGGYQHDSSPSQRASDGSLRGDYQPAETISEQWQELSASSKGEWAQAVGDLAQVVQAVNNQQLLSDAELERQLTTLKEQIQSLNLQQRKSYKFTGLSELAQAIGQQQFQDTLAASLEELGQQMQAVDTQIAQVRSLASALSRELQPKIAELAGTINQCQEEALIANAIAQIDEIAQQLEQKHSFDFGDLPQLLNGVSNEQRFRQSGLETKLATLTEQIAALTIKSPTQFEGISALAEDLQVLQAQSQLLEADLTERFNAIASVVTNFNLQGVRYEQDGEKALSELPQVLQSANNERVFENAGLESQLIALTQQLNDLNLQPQKYEFTGLSGLAQAISQQQSQGALIENLEQIGASLSKLTQLVALAKLPQEQVVDVEIAQVRSLKSALCHELRPGIETLAGAINQWQSQVEVTRAIAQIDKITQQLEQRHTFDFGDLPQLLNGVSNEQRFRQSGLDTELATLAEQIATLTDKTPIQFEGMSALAENLQAMQAQSQLLEVGLTEKLNEIALVVNNFNLQPVRYEFDSKALGELTQQFSSFNTRQQFVESGLLQQLLQTTNKAISDISQHNEQLQKDLSMLQTINRAKAVKRLDPISSSYTRQNIAAIANQVRDIPLEQVAVSLGLTRDKRDRHKWRAEGFVVSINEQKFTSTWLKGEGGVGAISFVLHVWGRDIKKHSPQDFVEAVNWLSSQGNYQPVAQPTSPQPNIPRVNKPFQPPVPDESRWHEVRQYLVEKRGLPALIVDKLHSDGKIYATGIDNAVLARLHSQGYSSPEKITNAVFLRHDLNNEVTGASLRGVADNSLFKGLSTGSHREGGCFSFVQGEGELKRIVIVESAIDALSAAALAKQPERTMFISTDGAGSVPTSWLKQQQQQGVEIVAAHDSDRPGEEMAWRLAAEVGAVTRATPTTGKDWNEHLLGIESQLDPAQWKLVAQAIGKPDAYLGRIEAVIASSQPLPIKAMTAMRLDFNAYKQTASDLWQWQGAAREVGRSNAYLGRITQVAISFHHPKAPTPLSTEAIANMQQDVAQHEQLLTAKLWQHYSRDADPAHPMKASSVVAYGAAKDGYSTDKINQILLHDPALVKIRGRSGEQAAQNHLKIALRLVDYKMRSHQQPQQINQQQSQQKPGLQL